MIPIERASVTSPVISQEINMVSIVPIIRQLIDFIILLKGFSE